jgi:hypothetical protein
MLQMMSQVCKALQQQQPVQPHWQQMVQSPSRRLEWNTHYSYQQSQVREPNYLVIKKKNTNNGRHDDGNGTHQLLRLGNEQCDSSDMDSIDYKTIDSLDITTLTSTPSPSATPTPAKKPATALRPNNGELVRLSSMITTRQCYQTIQLTGERSNEVFIVGGFNPLTGGMMPTVDSYNINTNTWCTESAVLPVPFACNSSCAAVDPMSNNLYIFGGISGNKCSLSVVQCYNTSTRTWSIVSTKMKHTREGAVVCWIPRYNGFIIMGGLFTSNAIEFYLPATNTFTLIPENILSIPSTANGCAAELQSLHLIADTTMLVLIPRHSTTNGHRRVKVLLLGTLLIYLHILLNHS